MKILYKVLLIFIALGIFAPSVFAQEENRKGSGFEKEEGFFVDILNYYSGKPDSTLVSVFVQVPYDKIQFYKTDDQFIASFSVAVSIFDDDKHLISEKVWDEKVIANNFEQTTSKSNYNISLKNFKLEPEKYSARVSVEDKNSRNNYVINKQMEVRKFLPDLDLSDIMLIAKETNTNGKRRIVPNVSRNVVTKKLGIPVFFQINSADNGKFRINYSITTKSGSRIFADTVYTDLSKGNNEIDYTLKDSSLNLGTYTINVEVENLDKDEQASVNCPLISRWSGLPENVSNLDLAISQLVYIATEDEFNYIRKAPNNEEKIKRFSDFWKKKDPNPNDEQNQAFDEYYGRVAYANDHFSHFREGWKTDMGMVYIILGKPDDVQRHPFDANSKPFELWDYYNLNRRFEFLDETGFGDYRLLNTADFDYVRQRVN